MNNLIIGKEFTTELEEQESLYWSEYYVCCGKQIASKLGTKVNVVNGTICCAAANSDTLAFNRAIGIGLKYEITLEQVENIKSYYETAGVRRFFLQVSPFAETYMNKTILKESGFEYYNNWMKFYKKLEKKLPENKSEIKIHEINFNETDNFENILKCAFEFENGLEKLFTQSYGRPGWKHYLAEKEGTAIGAASLFFCGKYASLAIAGTIPEARGNGVQAKLITRRINDAIEAGCEYIIVETAEDTDTKPSASSRNMKRFGFETAYLRSNYIFTF